MIHEDPRSCPPHGSALLHIRTEDCRHDSLHTGGSGSISVSVLTAAHGREGVQANIFNGRIWQPKSKQTCKGPRQG